MRISETLYVVAAAASAARGLTWKRRFGWMAMRGGSSEPEAEESSSKLSEATQAVLSMVPVFALTDDKGRPVLMRSPNATEKVPQQLFFTEVEVARAHAASIMRYGREDKLQLRLATLNLGQVWQMEAADREIRVYADPREVHFARQLLLRAAGYSNANESETGENVVDFSNETAVVETSAPIQAAIGVDLEKDVPVFTVGVLNATLGEGGKVVQPWFLSFGDLVRAYVNSTTPATDDDEEYQKHAQSALRKMLAVGETAVTTVAKLVDSLALKADSDVFIMPPSSSLTVLAQARQQAQQQQADTNSAGIAGDDLFAGDDDSNSDSGLFD